MNKITQKLLEQSTEDYSEFKLGKTIKGSVLDINSVRALVELPGGRTGIITRRESTTSNLEEESFEAGSEIEAVIIDTENEQGIIMLSLKRASQDTAWSELGKISEDERTIKVKIDEANKGGLMAKYKGIRAFLPVSQLMPVNYPRVEGADSGEILQKLQEHIGKDFVVRVINVNREEGKVIISEKLANESNMKETLSNIQVGDRVEGTVSGIVKFGIFVAFGGVEGLVHVSELEWGHVSNPGRNYKIGDKVEILIIGKDGDKLSFSIKQLTEDPWLTHTEKYSQGQSVSGKVVRWNDNGIFIEIEPEVQGFFDISQFGVEKASELKDMEEGKILKGKVTMINTDSHRLELERNE